MNNFEEALEHIEALEKQNIQLKEKLKAALWKLNSTSVEAVNLNANSQVGNRVDLIIKERDLAMSRFYKKMKTLSKEYKKERNGKSK